MDLATYRESFKPINIKDLFKDKNPSLARWIPGFIDRHLSRILQIDFVNDAFLWLHGHKNEHFVITFGKPIPCYTFSKGFNPNEWAQSVKDHVYSIAEDLRGVLFNHSKN